MTQKKKKTKKKVAPKVKSKATSSKSGQRVAKKTRSSKISKNKTLSKKVSKKVGAKKRLSKKKSTKKRGQGNSPESVSWLRRFARMAGFFSLRFGLLLLVFLLGYTVYLDSKIRGKFEGQKWALPAHVYTRPMELYVGQQIDRNEVQQELVELGYSDRPNLQRVGSFRFDADQISVFQRKFRFWDGVRPQQIIHLKLLGSRIQNIQVEVDGQAKRDTEIVRLEPRLFGSVSPLSHEDRSLVLLKDVPSALIDGLIANEDRQFYSHFGINPLGIARALISNVRAGRVVQGGSTLTQQLVKNYYLSSDQTFERKVKEAIMSVLLELHYSKNDILQAYINEVYLSQAGSRAIHGFDLASHYFFAKPLQELELHQIATLIAVNNGPSKYNPIRNPNNALKRRDLVLKTMMDEGKISESDYRTALASKLNVGATARSAAVFSYPSFLGLVRDDLTNDYLQNDLSNDGLQIHTTLNPRIQATLEAAVREELTNIEKTRNIEANSLQVAATVIRTDNGEVVAMLGDRKASFAGFNRAIKAKRPVGSLLKPFVYLSALESPQRFSLATPVSDMPITVRQKGSPDWTPQNYDNKAHGDVMLIDALSRSYNMATVRIGMDVGLDNVADTITRAGHEMSYDPLPSMLLGAVPMTVMDVGQLYLTLASGGFRTPVKSVRSVLSKDDQPLARYPLDIEQVIAPEFSVLINYALQDVMRNGTGRRLIRGFKYDYALAGKTGTTDEYRDSWFAGFSGNYLTVIWVGRDDNQSTGLTGASGAAKLWAKAMQGLPLTRLELPYHDDVVQQNVVYSRDPLLADCSLNRNLPMVIGSQLQALPCDQRLQYDEGPDDELDHFEAGPDTRERKPKKTWWQRIFR